MKKFTLPESIGIMIEANDSEVSAKSGTYKGENMDLQICASSGNESRNWMVPPEVGHIRNYPQPSGPVSATERSCQIATNKWVKACDLQQPYRLHTDFYCASTSSRLIHSEVTFVSHLHEPTEAGSLEQG